jgi:hypothetical protein
VMPIPKDVTGIIRTSNVFEGPDGRIYVAVWYQNRQGGEAGRRYLYDFFKGRVIKDWQAKKAPNSDISKMYRYMEGKGYRDLETVTGYFTKDRIPLPDGGRFNRTFDLTALFGKGLKRFDAAGRLLFHRMIVHISDRSTYIRGRRPTEFFGGRKFLRHRAIDLDTRLFPLADGTFLLLGGRRAVAIRFRGDLSSPYIRRSGKIVIIEPEKAWTMFAESWGEAGPIIRRLRKQIPDIPWIVPEITDELMVSKFKKLIERRKGTTK